MHRHLSKHLILLFLCFSCVFGKIIFASDDGTHMMLGINNTIAHMVYQPAYSSGFYTSGNVVATMTGTDISGVMDYTITANGTYNFPYLR